MLSEARLNQEAVQNSLESGGYQELSLIRMLSEARLNEEAVQNSLESGGYQEFS